MEWLSGKQTQKRNQAYQFYISYYSRLYKCFWCNGVSFGGAIEGIEVMSVIFAKRFGITVGTFVMIYNFQISKMRTIVHNIDEGAFITITEVADVFKSNMDK